MARRLFSELSPLTYRIAVERQCLQRRLRDAVGRERFAAARSTEDLPTKVYAHNSLIRRRLGNVDTHLQDGKAVSLGLTWPLVDGILIRPGETFSFWRLVGRPTEGRGYRPGVVISGDRADVGIGGGMCQFTNLLHWMTLHSPLTIVEHHHHGGLDLFPDFRRQIPFGTGTSIIWNFLDYRVHNPTDQVFQFRVRTDEEYLRGELRSESPWPLTYHVREDESYFYEAVDPRSGRPQVRRHNVIHRHVRSRRTGDVVERERLLENDAVVCYDRDLITAPILTARPVVPA
ncbi:VanW family protein [Tersicoccus sp. MR15.9]|uniref:VanW family protein n=1 Tax=Tersicoccus mangrovi TaxID=3121635 RepID=UPI002FE60938